MISRERGKYLQVERIYESYIATAVWEVVFSERSLGQTSLTVMTMYPHLQYITFIYCILCNVVNRGDWFWNSAYKHQRSKQRCQKLTTVHNVLFCTHTICMNYVINKFLLVSSSVRSKQLLCFVHGQGQKREQKHTTKKFVGFHNHSPLLTMPATRRDVFLP